MTSISDTNVVNAPGGLVELGYSEVTTGTITATTAPGTLVGFNLTVVCDGSPVVVEFATGLLQHFSNVSTYLVLYMDGSAVGSFANAYGSAYDEYPVFSTRRLTPSAGVHTFDVRVVSGGGGTNGGIYANNGSGTNRTPHLLRVSKVIQASQLIVQTPNAPLVTSLPSNAIDGQEVRYLADNTNGVVWNLRYRAGSSSSYKWEFIGGAPLYNLVSPTSFESTTSGSYVDLATVGPSLTVPLAGDYDVSIGGGYMQMSTTAAFAWMSYSIAGAAPSDYDGVTVSPYSGGNHVVSLHGLRRKTGISANSSFVAKYRSNGSSVANFGYRYMQITPIRVSA